MPRGSDLQTRRELQHIVTLQLYEHGMSDRIGLRDVAPAEEVVVECQPIEDADIRAQRVTHLTAIKLVRVDDEIEVDVRLNALRVGA